MTSQTDGRVKRSRARSYAPYLVIAVAQLVLLTLTPSPSSVTLAPNPAQVDAGSGVSALGAGQGGDGAGAGAAGTGVTDAAAGTAGAGGATARPGTPGGATVAATSAGAGPAATSSPATGTPGVRQGATATVDALGRPTSGDRAKCGRNGQLQEDVTVQAPPCIPAFVGDNGGATGQGVTRDTITIVAVHPRRQAGVQQALQAGGLSASDAQWEDVVPAMAEFFNRHYEFYGRKLKVENFWSTCNDAPCWRADAKAVQAKFHPFAVVWEGDYTGPEPFLDQLAQLGIMFNGVPGLSNAWFRSRAPYAWGIFPQAERQADMLADYYCKKMWGQNATRAGDPTMRVKRRKLGIVSSENPAVLDAAERFRRQVTGGVCGSTNDGTALYTFSADATAAQNEQATLVTRMKNDGVTTRATIGFVQTEQESDKQQYFPENLMSLPNDADIVGRLFQALGSPNQMRNTFGVGWLEQSQPLAQQDFVKAIRDVNPAYDPPRIAQATYFGLSLFATLIQWAGPRLTPQTIQAGARNSVQIGGWENPKPWPGWKCCNPYVSEYRFGDSPDSFTAKVDAKEEYWDSQAISADDNQPGAWRCVDPGCRRYEIGRWPRGTALEA